MSILLEATGLTKNFGGLVATDNLSFHVKRGESLGLIGPNGAGKTTIFNLLMNEVRANAGRVVMNARDITKLPTDMRVKRGLVRTYQVPRPFAQMSILENIRVSMMRDNLFDMITRPADHDGEMKLAASVGFTHKSFSQTSGGIGDG